MQEEIETKWDGQGFIPKSIRGVEVKAIRQVPKEEWEDFTKAIDIVGKYIRTDWNKEKTDTLNRIPDVTEFKENWDERTKKEKLYARAVYELGEPTTDELIEYCEAMTKENWVWRDFCGILSGWTRLAKREGWERVFYSEYDDEDVNRHRLNPKYRMLMVKVQKIP